MIFRLPFLFIFIVFSISLSAQTKLSDIENLYHPEEFATFDYAVKLNWKGKPYHVFTYDNVIKLSSLDDLNEPSIIIETMTDCNNVGVIGIKGDFLYTTSSSAILEFDLSDKIQTRRFPHPKSTPSSIYWLTENSILIKFSGATNLERKIAKLDINTGEFYFKTIPAARHLIYSGDQFIAFEYNNQSIVKYDLGATNDTEEIFSDSNLNYIGTHNFNTSLFFQDSQNSVYNYTSDQTLTQVCEKFSLEENEYTWSDGKYFYTKNYNNQNSSSDLWSIFSIENCNYLGYVSLDLFNSEVFVENENSITLLYSEEKILKIDHQSFKIDTFFLGFYDRYSSIYKNGKIYLISNSEDDETLISIVDIETKEVHIYNTFLKENSFFSKGVHVHVNEAQEVLISGIFDENLTTVLFDSTITEVNRKVLTNTIDYGLSIDNSEYWNIRNDAIYINTQNNILRYSEDSLVQLNDYPFHSGSIISDGFLYGFLNRNDSTFFDVVDIQNNTSLFENNVDFQEIFVSYELMKISDEIYLKENNGDVRKIYPYGNIETLELSNMIRTIYHKAKDKILVLTDYHDLAWFDGESFEIVQHEVNSYTSTYQHWNQNSVVKTLVIDSDQGVAIFSFDEETGESFINERFNTGYYINGGYDQSGKEWKVIATFNSDNDNVTLYAFNGNQIKNIDLQELEFEAVSGSYSYVNEHVFFSNRYNRSYAYSELTGVIDLSALFPDQIIADVYYANNQYYITTYSNDDVFVKSLNQELDLVTDIFSSYISDCSTLRDHYFLGKRDDENLLLVLSTAEWGKEIYNLSLTSDEVSLIADINEGPLSGFQQLEFITDNALYFTGQSERSNTQLYKIDIQNELTNSITKDEFRTLNVFPNPVNKFLYLSEPLENILIYDLHGKAVIQNTTEVKMVDVENLISGIYMIEGNTISSRYQAKFIKI
jgi:hypothetical protein